MSIARDFMTSTVGQALGPAVRAAAREAAQEVLDENRVVAVDALQALDARVRALEEAVAVEQATGSGSLESRVAALEASLRGGAGAAASDDAPKHCTVPGCDEPHRSKGYCGKHYQRWRRGTL